MRSSGTCGVLAAAALLALVIGTAAGVGGAYYYLSIKAPTGDTGPLQPPARVSVVTDEDAIVNAVATADPAVVKIVATTVTEPRDPFEFFFGGPRVQQGLGSGFAVEYQRRKIVLTNAHVVGDAQEIRVQTRDGREHVGKVLGMDRPSDVAVLEVEGDIGELATMRVGNSDHLRIGEWVVAIGHPFAFDHTVTVGVVSALGQRALGGTADSPMRNVIQTDAAINQGNSGGPLVNLAGEVVGINSMIFSPTGTSLGIGFAIPINDAMQTVHFLMNRGPWIGIERAMPNSAGLARYLGLQTDVGVVILSVFPDSPAASAGLRPGDVILSIDGKQITNGEELRAAVFAAEIGATLTFEIQRGAQRLQVRVKTGTIPEGYYG